jgi:phosphoglycolate phosphatase-like HAD superfamily hydrolase
MGKEGDEAFLAEVAHAFSAHVLAEMAKVPLVAGAMEFLAAATGCLPVYLASVTPIEELSQILDMRDLRHWFEDVYGCPPWNKPDAIRDVLKREGAAPGETLLIGDSAGDQRAALATGVPFIARDSGLGFDLPLPARFGDLIQIMSHLRTEHSWPI